MPMYLGPLGGLTAIHPLTGVTTTSQRYGGVHRAINGGVTVDNLGHRAAFELKWRHLTPSNLAFLEALHHRHIEGPFRFILGDLKPNRLSRSAASLAYGGRDMSGVTLVGGAESKSSLWPTDAPPSGSGLTWSGWGATSALQLDRTRPVPVVPGEVITASVYVRSNFANTVRLDLDPYGSTGFTTAVTGTAVTLAANTWQRLTLTYTVPAAVWAVSPSLHPSAPVDPSSTLTLAAAQIEVSPTASPWLLGGGAPEVDIEALPTESPYANYTDAETTLLEV